MRFLHRILAILVPAALLVLSIPQAAGEHGYVGSTKCKMCHLKEWKSWSETRMAQSFEVLRPGARAEEKKTAGLDPGKDYTADATCLACHTTGYGKAGGFVDVATTADLVGVGCEMCHGPGGTYTQREHMSLTNKEYRRADLVAVGMVGEITVEQCKNCHNADSPFVGEDYGFDFEANKEKGTHEKIALKYPH